MAKVNAVREGAIRMGAKRQVTIPRRISEALHLREGDHLLMRLVGGASR